MAEKGTLVLDCEDEKPLWLDALFPWLISSGLPIKENSVHHTSSSSRSSSSSSMTSMSQASGRGGGRLGIETLVAEQAIIIDSKGRGVQQIMTTSLSTAAAAMIGVIKTGGGSDVRGSNSSHDIAAVATNAKKATSDLMRAFTVSTSLSSNSSASASNSNPKLSPGTSVVNIEALDTPLIRFSEIESRDSASKSVTPALIRELTPVPSSSKRTFPNANTIRNGNRLIDGEDEADGDVIVDYSGILDLLDAVKRPLSNTKIQLVRALDLSLNAHVDTTFTLRSALQGVAQAVIGLSCLRTLADEVIERMVHIKMGWRYGIREEMLQRELDQKIEAAHFCCH